MGARWPRTAGSSLVIVFALVVLVAGLPGRLPAATTQHTTRNAAWLGVEWVMEPAAPEAVYQLASHLSARRITTVYVFATYLRADGSWNPTYAHARAFTEKMRIFCPGCGIQAWIGLPLDPPVPGAVSGHVDLADARTRAQVADLAVHLTQDFGFDGVHLDPETVVSGDQGVLLLLSQIREAVGEDVSLSIATRRISPVGWPWAQRALGAWAWSDAYYRDVAARVDQVALMTYDSALLMPGHYRLWTRLQTRRLARVLASSDAELFVGVPTSREHTATHHPWAENMRSGLSGVAGAYADRQVAERVTGVAVYPYWETTDADWAFFADVWLSD